MSLLASIIVIVCFTSVSSLSQCVNSGVTINNEYPIHTLLLCRHGDSIWNGGQPGMEETFTGWTDVPLSTTGIKEAKSTGEQVANSYTDGIDACFTSILGRAQLTAHHCLWGFSEKDYRLEPKRFVSDYRLNERHYGSLQGYVKREVEMGKYGHNPKQVVEWRRSWHAIPPLLDDNDPRRIEEVKRYSNYCGGANNVPRGESLEMVANNRIEPFLRSSLIPILNDAAEAKNRNNVDDAANNISGGTGLVVAHANSLRALIGVICNVSEKPAALRKLEAMKVQTGVPLVLRFQQTAENTYRPIGSLDDYGDTTTLKLPVALLGNQPPPDLPVWPLHCLPHLLRLEDQCKNDFTSRSQRNGLTVNTKKEKIKQSVMASAAL